MAKKQKNNTGVKIETININNPSHRYDKTQKGRLSQLTAFFHMLKMDVGDESFSSMTKDGDEIYIPYSFNLQETMCLCLHHIPDMMYIELDEENYIEIGFDSIKISGTPDFMSLARTSFKKAENYGTILGFFTYNYSETVPAKYKAMIINIYDKCISLGNEMLKNGSFKIYPMSSPEKYIESEDDWSTVSVNDIEYILLRSNLESDKVIFLDLKRKLSFSAGMDALEESFLSDLLKP